MNTLQEKLLPTLDFFLFEWLDVPSLLTRPRFGEHDDESISELLHATADIAAEFFEPANRAIDDHEPRIEDGRVVLPIQSKEAWDAFVSFGFLLASHDSDLGGMQLPRTVESATKVILASASVALVPSMLTEANASLLIAYGTANQREVFARRELSGKWSGTMCMSESEAGSSLSDITTRAIPDGLESNSDPLGPRYRITGNKMWISGGEHDLTENIIHLVLAKVPGPSGKSDPGTRGISLFIVPKHLVGPDGEIGDRNDVTLVSLNHKLGFRGIPNTALAFGDGTWTPGGDAGAIGYLVGKVGDGLGQMFHMMNAARIDVGLGAAALGFAGFSASLQYANERRQGRPMGRFGKDASQAPIPIVQHADVKRMLLAQKAYAEGAIGLGLYAAKLVDDRETGDAATAAEARELLEILTPVVKSWPSEWCLEANSLAIQVLGGCGYARDFPVEQFWRDNRLNMIHEGTHGIQGLDLLGRKATQRDGVGLKTLEVRIQATIARAHAAGLESEAASLAMTWQLSVQAATEAWSTDEPSVALANATLYLQGFGHTVLSWIWLDVAVCAMESEHEEAKGKVAAMQYFFAYEVPHIQAWLRVVADRVILCEDLDAALL